MIQELKAGYDGLMAAGNIVQGIFSIKSEVERNQAVITIQRHVLDGQKSLTEAQAIHAAQLQRISDLEQKIASMENWEAEKKCYEIKAIDVGAFAYMHKEGMNNGEPPMWFCQTCFEKGQRSSFQFRGQDAGAGRTGGRGQQSRWGCNLCKSEVTVSYRRKPSEPWPAPETS